MVSMPDDTRDASVPMNSSIAPMGAEGHLRWVLENTPIVLWALDRDGIVTLSEGKALQGMGYVPGQLVGISALELYRDRPDLIVGLRRALTGEEFINVVDSHERTYETHHRPLRDATGALMGTLCVTLDVTERIRAEKERAELHVQLLEVQKLESLALLAGGIAHDFNNLLTAILGSASAALPSLAPGSAARANVDNITVAARRAASLTRQLLAYSGKGPFEIREVDLSAQARELARLLTTTLSPKVQISLDLPLGLPDVLADVAQLQQIIMNLVINAAEAIGEDPGSIVIATATRDLDAHNTRTFFAADNLVPGPHVYVEVRDSGCGMDEETRMRIFEPFYSTKRAGRGLGLSAVLGIVRAHKGGIEVLSTPGHGSTFRVFFPGTERTEIIAAKAPSAGSKRSRSS
jgi:two-component system, cell cycle sensor histidine kinase and response regulator CckA